MTPTCPVCGGDPLGCQCPLVGSGVNLNPDPSGPHIHAVFHDDNRETVAVVVEVGAATTARELRATVPVVVAWRALLAGGNGLRRAFYGERHGLRYFWDLCKLSRRSYSEVARYVNGLCESSIRSGRPEDAAALMAMFNVPAQDATELLRCATDQIRKGRPPFLPDQPIDPRRVIEALRPFRRRSAVVNP